MVFHGSLSDSNSPQVSRNSLSILVDLNKAVDWMVSTCPSPPVFVSIIWSTHYNWYNHHSRVPQLLQFSRSSYLSFFSLSFNFTLWSAGIGKSTILQVLFLLLIIIRSTRLAGIWWSACISKSQRSLCVSFSRTDSRLCIYNFFVWSNFNFLRNSQSVILPTQSCLV